MSEAERKLPAFQRPKRWFKKKEWATTVQQKVFGLSTPTGKIIAFLIPKPFNSHAWAKCVKEMLGPALKREFPRHEQITILLDGEKVFWSPEAKRVYADFNIRLLPGWPAQSPELNPQENVWPWAENCLRDELEYAKKDTFDDFQRNVLLAVRMYETPEKLVPSMTKRIQECIEKKGNMIDH